MDQYFHPTLDSAYDCLSTLKLKLIHFSKKKGPQVVFRDYAGCKMHQYDRIIKDVTANLHRFHTFKPEPNCRLLQTIFSKSLYKTGFADSFTKVCFIEVMLSKVNIGSSNGLAPNRPKIFT